MEEVKKKYDIGVIIGRFQVPELHEAHRAMIDEVLSRHDKVVLFLGVSPTLATKRNPLDFLSRKVMFEETYGNRISAIFPLNDKKSDYVWSKQVDTKIREAFPIGSVVLYGSRDSFIPHYHGRFDVIELVPASMVSATEIRNIVSKKVERTKEFRSGVIYACYNNFATVHPTIDVAILDETETKVLLGRKPGEDEFRFIGGFVDVTDGNLEQTVRREAFEETGVEVGDIRYLASMQIKDWRYRSDSERSIMTTFFAAKKLFGTEKANDDIQEVKWFRIEDISNKEIVTEHVELLKILKEKLKPVSVLNNNSIN